MLKKRIERLNSLLKEVISEVVTRDVRNPHVNPLITITRVDISNDLQHAKVYISVIGPDLEKQQTLEALESAAGFIAVHASKKVVMRYFPALTFRLDTSVDQHMRIDTLLGQIHDEQKTRGKPLDE
jgi:ribosome-binding factor A